MTKISRGMLLVWLVALLAFGALLPNFSATASDEAEEEAIGEEPSIEESKTPANKGPDDQTVQREEETIKLGGFSAAEFEQLGEIVMKHQNETEVSRMLKLMINLRYRNNEIFLRELISNASDALEKIRLISLTDPGALKATEELSIRIKADKENHILHITDTGIGMTKQDLINNLGTIARFGTSEFISKMRDSSTSSEQQEDLIGQFRAGFYSAFLVADRVVVTSKHNDDKQCIWESDSHQFSIVDDPRGNTLGRGTHVSLHLKDEAYDFLEQDTLKKLIHKYSQSTNFDIYLWQSRTETVEEPVEEEAAREEKKDEEKTKEEGDEVEKPKMKTMKKTVWDWEKANMHFTAEGECEVGFKSIRYVPKTLSANAFQNYCNIEENIKHRGPPSAEPSHNVIKLAKQDDRLTGEITQEYRWKIKHDSPQCDASSTQTGQQQAAAATLPLSAEPGYAIRLAKRDDRLAREIAQEHGWKIKLMGRPFLDSHYYLAYAGSNDDKEGRERAIEELAARPEVLELLVARPKKRVKRDYIEPLKEFIGPIAEEKVANRRQRRQQTYFGPRPVPKLPFTDPLYQDQWYLIGQASGGFDMNVRKAWMMGYAGRNVTVSILDDGLQKDHPDLAKNYDQLASFDINDNDTDPTPQDNGENKHGTRCAGEVAATAGNNVCGVGIAFLSRIGGVRMLDGHINDFDEAASLNRNLQHIDIYSASWGPDDDGETFDGPGRMVQDAFYQGIKQGRSGRGNIFVWASGNGGEMQDSCSADGYSTSIYTLSISSATYANRNPSYLEECPSTIATTYSSGNTDQPAIVTVDVPTGCTDSHSGTSASAPLAAGIIALALEANPSLTWRDVQHIVLRTANPNPLLNNEGWTINGVGRRISNKFGYGLMDAYALVKRAREWQTVPEQHMCTYEYIPDAPRPIQGHFAMNFSLEVNGCQQGTPILSIEHVQVIATIRFGKRGDLKLTLFSPMGTRSVLLPPRPHDDSQNGFPPEWPFLTLHMWGEDPLGIWTLMVESVSTKPDTRGTFTDWTLLLHGTGDQICPRYAQNPADSALPSCDGSIPW